MIGLLACGCLLLAVAAASGQARQRTTALSGVPALDPPSEPVVLYSNDHPRIRVVPIATGLSHPWGIAFRRNGDILVTERNAGTLRVIRDGVLDPRPIPGVPEVYMGTRLAGLMDIALHPDDDRLVYLTYSKPAEQDGRRGAVIALARGRLDAGALTEVRDVFVSEGFGRGVAASRVTFGPDGKVYMTIGGAIRSQTTGLRAQDPAEHVGKVLRLNDDGTAPDDNPFVGEPGYLPEIYSMGHRNQLGLTFHPDDGTLWASENAPQGGDEVNVILPGRNYGWPIASDGREYTGVRVSDTPWLADFERPEILWWPSIAPSGLTFYDGEHFPAWRGNLFVGSMTVGRMQRTGHLERVVFNRRGEEMGREWLLGELKQRIRDVRQGPDGYLYVLTEEDNAALLRIEPARAVTGLPGSVQPHRRLREPRIPPLPAAEWTEAQRAVVDRYAPDGNPGNALRTLVRVPALADRVFPFMHYVANESTLSPRHREILILRTAWLAQNGYLWAAHAARAAEAGLTPEEILSTAEGPSQERWEPFENVLVGLADQLFGNSSVSDETWGLLSERYDVHNLIDAVATVADTTTLSILFNALGVQPDDDTTARLPVDDVAYRVIVPAREPPLAAPRIEPVEGSGLRVSRTFRRHPALADAWNENSGYVMNPERSGLAPHDRELLILRTGWNAQAVYEWAKHVGSVGRARDHIDAVATVADTTTLSILFNALGIQPDEGTMDRLPVDDVAYRVIVPAREPPLETARVEPVEGSGLRVSRTFRQHPALADAWNENPGYVMNPERAGLAPHDRELLILRTGWNAQAVYEWAKHVGSVGRARDHGLDPHWIAQGHDAAGWDANELLLIDAANEMYRDTTVSDETWAALAELYSEHQMMSIVATAARYRKVSMFLNALGVQPLPDDERFPVLAGY